VSPTCGQQSSKPAELRSTVLKLAHHGGETPSTALFMDAVKPEIIIASSGRRSLGGTFSPDASVLRRYCNRNPNARSYRTAQDEVDGRTTRHDADADHIVFRTNELRCGSCTNVRLLCAHGAQPEDFSQQHTRRSVKGVVANERRSRPSSARCRTDSVRAGSRGRPRHRVCGALLLSRLTPENTTTYLIAHLGVIGIGQLRTSCTRRCSRARTISGSLSSWNNTRARNSSTL
jgi:hypothetical protein